MATSRSGPPPHPRRRVHRSLRAGLIAGAVAAFAGAGAADGLALADAGCPSEAAVSPAAFEAVFRAAAPAVVRVLSIRYRRPGEADLPSAPFLPLAQGKEQEGTLYAERSAASGFIVSPEGLVLGSAHSVQGAAETWVELRDGHQHLARVVGVDTRLDLALLRIDARGLPALAVAHEDPRPGQWVAAIGAPFGFEQSISAGMVSAFPREMPGIAGVGLIQTDVAINPGSSGGPLLNACGQAVGMSAMVFSSQGLYVGVTFAVPARRLLQAAATLLDGGAGRGSAGLLVQSLSPALAHAFHVPAEGGALVTQVEPGGAADEAGLREGDVVLRLEGLSMPNADVLDERLAALPVGRRLGVELWRDGARLQVQLRLQAMPGEPGPGPAGPGAPRLGLVFGHAPQGGVPLALEGLHVLEAEGAAMLAGIDGGDCIAAVNGRRVSTVREFDLALAAANATGARTVALLVVRDGVRAWLPVRLSDVPAGTPQRP